MNNGSMSPVLHTRKRKSCFKTEAPKDKISVAAQQHSNLQRSLLIASEATVVESSTSEGCYSSTNFRHLQNGVDSNMLMKNKISNSTPKRVLKRFKISSTPIFSSIQTSKINVVQPRRLSKIFNDVAQDNFSFDDSLMSSDIDAVISTAEAQYNLPANIVDGNLDQECALKDDDLLHLTGASSEQRSDRNYSIAKTLFGADQISTMSGNNKQKDVDDEVINAFNDSFNINDLPSTQQIQRSFKPENGNSPDVFSDCTQSSTESSYKLSDSPNFINVDNPNLQLKKFTVKNSPMKNRKIVPNYCDNCTNTQSCFDSNCCKENLPVLLQEDSPPCDVIIQTVVSQRQCIVDKADNLSTTIQSILKTVPENSEIDLNTFSPKESSVCLESTIGSDASTLESQNMIQCFQNNLHRSTPLPQSAGLDSTVSTQFSRSPNKSLILRSAAVASARQAAGTAYSASEVLGQELGSFFGLPSAVQDLLFEHRGISCLYDWQKECIRRGLNKKNLLISMPTSGGKTLVAEILMLRTLLIHNKHAVFLLPYVAIVQEKVRGLSPLAVSLGFLLEEYAGSKGSYPPKKRIKKNVAFVATIEKATGLVNSFLEEQRADELGLVIVDEAHMLGEQGGRGALLEATITKLRYAAKHVQIVAMSATISNLTQLGEFLGAELYTDNFRPVKLRQYVKINDQVAEINPSALTDDELLINHRVQNFKYTAAERARDQDCVAGLVREVLPHHSVLVFCSTRRNCESLAKLLCSLLPRSLLEHNRKEKKQLYVALAQEGGGNVCPILREVLPYGLAYHHSGLTEGERKLLEEGYLAGTLCVLTCTSTLAAGVNLPARRVVLRSPYTGRERLTRSRYMQMVGRAGRAGLDSEGESFLIIQPKEVHMIPDLVRGPVETCHSRLCDYAHESTTPFAHATALPSTALRDRFQTAQSQTVSGDTERTCITSAISSTNDKTISSRIIVEPSILMLSTGLRDLVFSSVALGLVKNLFEANELVKCSLMALQAKSRGLDLFALICDIFELLRSCGMLRIKDDCSSSPAKQEFARQSCNNVIEGNRTSKALFCDVAVSGLNSVSKSDLNSARDRVSSELLPHHELVVSRLGRAAIKGCVELSIASRLYEDLLVARDSLAVHSRLHLLYLVTPYSAAYEIPLIPHVFFQAFCQLTREEVKVAELIGVTEAEATKVAMGKQKSCCSDILRRFNAAILIHQLLSGVDIWKVSVKFEVPRGLLQRTLSAAAAFASCVYHFCQELEELWAFKDLLASFARQLSGCCSSHLLPLMDLPAVKIGRAKLLYSAGFTTLHSVANSDPEALIRALHHLPRSTAIQMINSAKALLLEQAEALQERAEQLLLGLTEFVT